MSNAMKRFVGLATLVLLVAGMTMGLVWAQAPAAGNATTDASDFVRKFKKGV